MTDQTEFRTLKDGSIDYGHYMARARKHRSGAFLAALGRLRSVCRATSRVWTTGGGKGRIAGFKPARRGVAWHPGE